MELPDFSKIFHQSSKDHARGHPPIPPDVKDWPDEWKTTYYKAYPRLPKVALEDVADLRGSIRIVEADKRGKTDLFDLIKNRKSRRDFMRGHITKRELSLLLKYSCGETGPLGDGRHRRAQPSGGARFPIEVYPLVFRNEKSQITNHKSQTNPNDRNSDGKNGEDSSASPQNDDETVPNRVSSRRNSVWDEPVKAGLYHYNVKDHALDVLWDREFNDEDINELFSYPWVKDATLALVMTAVFWRNQNKYGERGYRYILHEAGHIGQNIYLVSEALGLKCCALGGTNDENLEKLIDIDGITESIVYALAIGK